MSKNVALVVAATIAAAATSASAAPAPTTRSMEQDRVVVVKSSASDGRGDQAIDLKRAALRTGSRTLQISIRTYDVVTTKTMGRCGSIRIFLDRNAVISLDVKSSSLRGTLRAGDGPRRVPVTRPDDHTFELTVDRSLLPGYDAHGQWLVAAEGGGFCEGPLLQDAIPDKGAIAP